MSEFFNVGIALEDNGVCRRQKVKCDNCPIGIFLGLAGKDQLCNHKIVYQLSKLAHELTLASRAWKGGEGGEMNGVKTLEYLKRKEWSMGNGQCPECYGSHEGWFGHPCHLDARTIGHSPGCIMAAVLCEAGEKPLMLGEFVPQEKQP